MIAICAAGVGLVAYSRSEALRPAKKAATVGPTANSNWYAAYATDICGVLQPDLPADSSTPSIGLRTFGNGLINIAPAAAGTKASSFEGTKATLALFASSYPNFKLSATSLTLPQAKSPTYANGTTCKSTTSDGVSGAGKLTINVWSSVNAKTPTVYSDPTKVALKNGQMITVAFVPSGTSVPQPSSKATLAKQLGVKITKPSAKKKS